MLEASKICPASSQSLRLRSLLNSALIEETILSLANASATAVLYEGGREAKISGAHAFRHTLGERFLLQATIEYLTSERAETERNELLALLNTTSVTLPGSWAAELGLPSDDVVREDAPHVSNNEEEKTEASKETVK